MNGRHLTGGGTIAAALAVGLAIVFIALAALVAVTIVPAPAATALKLTARMVADTLAGMAKREPIVVEVHFGNGRWVKHNIDLVGVAATVKVDEFDIRVRVSPAR